MEPAPKDLPSAPRLRGLLAEANLPIYVIAAAARIHPRELGEMLNERRPMPPEKAARIADAIRTTREAR